MIAAELQLFVLLSAFYLYECSLLLYTNQAVVSRNQKGLWKVSFGSERWIYRGRELYLLNPFTPFRPVYLLSWNLERLTETGSELSAPPDSYYSHYAIFIAICSAGIFLVFPYVLLLAPSDRNVIGVMTLIYGSLLYISLVLYTERDSLGLTRKEAFSIACEYLLCPPLAVNVIRRISLRRKHRIDLVSFLSSRHIEPASKNWSKIALLERIDHAIYNAESDNQNLQRLSDRRRQIAGL